MQAEFSEFSYGFAVVHELIRLLPVHLRAAPLFPSLRKEGQPGFGYDVHLNLPGIPIFLQFKLSERIVSKKAKEVAMGRMTPPYYRFHIRSTPWSLQHQALYNLAQQQANFVYYVVPAFYSLSDFDYYFLTRTVLQHSVLVSAADIGPLPFGDTHRVAFRPGHRSALLFSEPKRLACSTADRIIQQLSAAVRSETTPFAVRIDPMLRMLRHILPVRGQLYLSFAAPPDLVDESPLAKLARLVAIYLGCSLIIVQSDAS